METMRIVMVAGVAALVLALGAGCADDSEPAATTTSAAAAVSPSAAAADPACDGIKELQVQYFNKVIADLHKAAQASQGGDTAGANAALQDAGKLATEWAGKLEPLAGQAASPELKSAATQFAAQLKQFGAGTANIAQIQTAGPTFLTALLKACP
jgi:hypothetical protein